jgi:hypothetical protein
VACLAIYCADVGSLKELDGRFGWARVELVDGAAASHHTGRQIDDLVGTLEADLRGGVKVALGFECPLFFPVPLETARFYSSRAGEGNRPWSVAAGLWALRAGLVQVPWLLAELRRRRPRDRVFLNWEQFEQARRGLFLWEAFVSRDAKLAKAAKGHSAHERDALTGALAFVDALGHDDLAAFPRDTDGRTLSLVGVATLWSGWADDPGVLHAGCLIVQALDPTIATLAREAGPALARAHAVPVAKGMPSAPSRPGLYAVHAPARAWKELGLRKPPDERPLYVGKSESSLAGRDVTGHFGYTKDGRATSVTGNSTLRRALAALLHDSRGYRGRPRNPVKPGYFSNFGLSPEQDDELSDWMRKHLQLACWPKPDSVSIEQLKRVERAVAQRLLPPLNLDGVVTPWKKQLEDARLLMRTEAKEWRPPRRGGRAAR